VTGRFIRGALIEFRPAFGPPLPNVIAFQFNPETMTHAWTQAESAGGGDAALGRKANPLAVRGLPGESFSFSLMLDAAEPIADGDPVSGPIAQTSGVYARLAALEMLQFPVPADATARLARTAPTPGGRATAKRRVPEGQVPTVLFVWGPRRIVPVRVTALSITEQLYDPLLNPTHAEATITLQVLTRDDFAAVTGRLSTFAKGAYNYTHGVRQALALVNLGNTAESTVGMLPL
jgi:hypothetical protein